MTRKAGDLQLYNLAAMVLLIASLFAPGGHADAPVPVAAPERPSIALSEGDTAGEQWEIFFDQLMVRNVSQAAMYPVLPSPDSANGRAVIIVPGGGYRFVSMQNEGFPVAEALASRGYAAFVLKYRPHPTVRDGDAFMAELKALFGNLGKAKLPERPEAVDDLANALAYIDTHAEKYDVDRDRMAVIGFSAGARTAIRLLEQRDAAAKVDSLALIYPPMADGIESDVRPPLFVAIAVDDPLFEQGQFTLLESWLAQSKALEFHLFSGGGHGFGTIGKGTSSEGWLDSYLRWLDLQ